MKPISRILAVLLAVFLTVDPSTAAALRAPVIAPPARSTHSLAGDAAFQEQALMLGERFFLHVILPSKALFQAWRERWAWVSLGDVVDSFMPVPQSGVAGEGSFGSRRPGGLLDRIKFPIFLQSRQNQSASSAIESKPSILYAAMESQFAKRGGEADFIRDITRTMARHKHPVSVVTPEYGKTPLDEDARLDKEGYEIEERKELLIPLAGGSVRMIVKRAKVKVDADYLTYFFIEDPDKVLFQQLYAEANHLQGLIEAIVLSRATCMIPSLFDITVDAVHVNDWQVGLAPVYRRTDYAEAFRNTAFIYTSHNMEYHGTFNRTYTLPGSHPLIKKLRRDRAIPFASSRLRDIVTVDAYPLLGLPNELITRASHGLEWYGRISLDKGIAFADLLSGVSENNMEELTDEASGAAFGMHGVVGEMRDAGKTAAVYNGTDQSPHSDPFLKGDGYVNFSADETRLFDKKKQNKTALIKELGWSSEAIDDFIVASVGRIANQKGVDLLEQAIRQIAEETTPPNQRKIRFVILGSADATDDVGKAVQHQLSRLAAKYPGQVKFINKFDARMASHIYAGADAFVMPSRLEPGGIANQLANKYGTPVIAPLVGGLVDFFLKWGGVGVHLRKFIPGQETTAINSIVEAVQNMAREYWFHRNQWNSRVRDATLFHASWEERATLYEEGVYGKAIRAVRAAHPQGAQPAVTESRIFERAA